MWFSSIFLSNVQNVLVFSVSLIYVENEFSSFSFCSSRQNNGKYYINHVSLILYLGSCIIITIFSCQRITIPPHKGVRYRQIS